MKLKSELLSPAGDFETARAAFAAGADAVYCGLEDFSARAFAKNFSEPDLKALVRLARSSGKRVYVTFNTLVDEGDLETAVDRLSRLALIGPDAIIVQDLGVARLARKYFPGLELHASTQLVAHNLEGVLALKGLGFRRVVLARELSCAEIDSIAKRCGARTIDPETGRPELELEVFIHGALCYSISGLCLYGAMEKGRSGNRGMCPYCCRQSVPESPDSRTAVARYPFSMKDLRLGEDVRKLVELGVASLKIEGRMKSPLYVASVTRWYRQFLEGGQKSVVTSADLETVFSRRTTELRLNGDNPDVIDSESLGHRGTPIGTVKKITRDREGLAWLRFHTSRALERHDGLQFEALTADGRHFGFGVTELRQAISRTPVFEVAAGTDVEVLLPHSDKGDEPPPIHAGDTVFCSMSNAVKRMFPAPVYRPSDYPGVVPVNLAVTLAVDRLSVTANGNSELTVFVSVRLEPARDASKTFGAIEKAFSKLGGTDYRLGKLEVSDPDRLFAPAPVLNDLRRKLVEALDAARECQRIHAVEAALSDSNSCAGLWGQTPEDSWGQTPKKVLKVRENQKIIDGFDEIVVAIAGEGDCSLSALGAVDQEHLRLALPIWNGELKFNKMRQCVKSLLRGGFRKWECSDLATLRMLRELKVEDVTADWSLYAFNSAALASLAELGVRRVVASPDNTAENLRYLAESGFPVEFLTQQSTPLFISLHRPVVSAIPESLSVFEWNGLWVTTRPTPRSFAAPDGGGIRRVDLSWDA